MAKKMKTAKKRISQAKKVVFMPSELPTFQVEPSKQTGISKTGIIAIVLGVIILGILAVNRGLIIAAVVNNKLIFRSTVNKALVSRYGTQTLENMITEQLISDEAAKQKVTVSKEEIEAKEQEILASFGGNVTLEEVLSYQGMTKEDFDQQIKLQMQLTKIIGKDITITDDEVTTYIADNPSTLIATDSDGMQKEAREAILTQKVSEQLQTWYAALKEKAKVYRLMK
ncbi:MAG: hypothetical protein WAV51_04950 [Microgenomates group bacterium]